jgi:ribosomal protein L29
MTTGERGRTPPDAEHYLDLPDTPEEAAGPHFDVVLRGYDRAQVDDHVAGLRRMVAQLRAQLAVRERRRPGPEEAAPARGELAATLQEGARTTPPPVDASASAPTVPPGSMAAEEPGGVEAFNERLRGILQAAEQEAQLVRSKAAESLLAEHAESRAALADLRSQRDSVFDELVRVKNHLDELVSNSGRPNPPPRQWGPGPQRGPRGPYGGPGPYGPAPPGGPVPLRATAPPQPGPDARPGGQDDAAGA